MLRIKNLRWEFGTVLPEEIKYNLCEQEVILAILILLTNKIEMQ